MVYLKDYTPKNMYPDGEDGYDPKEFTFEIDCVHAIGEDIQELVDSSTDITYGTFLKHVAWQELRDLFPTYTWTKHNDGGLKLKDDWAVSYCKGQYQDRECYFVWHSGIEYIFTRLKERPE